MIEAIDSLDGQLAQDIAVWCMAIVTGGHRRMRPPDPRVVLRIHDMAIDACRRVIRQVGGPICVQEHKKAYPDDKSGHEVEKWCLFYNRRPAYSRSVIV